MSEDIYSEFIKKIRFLFCKISWKKSLIFLFFVIMAVIFWFMQIYSQKIVMKVTIPIKYTNVSDEIIFEHNLPESIEVDIRDQGSSGLNYATKRNDSLEINIGAIIKESPSGKTTLQGQDLEQLIRSMLLASSEVISYSPTYISYAYNKVSVRKLPVLFDGVMSLSTGYQLDGDITISPDTVIAYGSKAALDTLKYAYTSIDTISNIKSSQKIAIPLRAPRGVDFKPQKVYIDIPVDNFLDKEANVPIECLNLPENLSIKFFPSEITVSFTVGEKRSNLIKNSDFKIQVDYKDIKELKTSVIPVRIIETPEFVRIKSLNPGEVEFILEQKQ